MSSSPRSGGDPDCVIEIESEQEQSNPTLLVAGEEDLTRPHDRVSEEASSDEHNRAPEASSGEKQSHPRYFEEEKLMKQSHSSAGHPASSAGHPAPKYMGTIWNAIDFDPLWPLAPVSFPPTEAVAAGDPGTSDLTRPHEADRVSKASSDEIREEEASSDEHNRAPEASSDEKQSHPRFEEGLPSGKTIKGSIEEIVSFVEKEIYKQLVILTVQNMLLPSFTTFRVPQISSSFDENAYAPQFVSFGPCHRGTEALSSGGKYKWFFLELICHMNRSVSLRKYFEEMDRLKKRVKYFYEEGILIQKNYGFTMLLLDGCCILGFLDILPLPPQAESKRTADLMRSDLFLIGNQLPFIVLETIYGLATGTPDELKYKVDQAIQKLLPSYPLKSITTDQSFRHLLECCHLKFKPTKDNSSSANSKPTRGEIQPWRGATDLYKAGIKFKPKKCGPSESLLDVELVSGKTLMIPTLNIDNRSSSVFRNLIAFEQSCTDEEYFTAYAFFMGELMRTPGDVTLLVKKGVVENYLGSDKEVSDFFNNLVKHVVFNVHGEHFLSSTFEELKRSYNNVAWKHIADLMQNYCGSPWLVISVVAAAIVLVCTVVQTLCAVIK